MNVISRDEAMASGAKRFFTGLPCPHGHIAERIVSSRMCMVCNRLRGIANYAKDKQVYLNRMRDAYIADPEKFKEYQRQHRAANLERVRERERVYANKHGDRRSERAREWCAANPDRVRLLGRVKQLRRIARMKSAEGSFSANDVVEMLAEQGGGCKLCSAVVPPYHVDHIRPLSKGGSNYRTNLQLLCPPCNLKKGAKWDGYKQSEIEK